MRVDSSVMEISWKSVKDEVFLPVVSNKACLEAAYCTYDVKEFRELFERRAMRYFQENVNVISRLGCLLTERRTQTKEQAFASKKSL